MATKKVVGEAEELPKTIVRRVVKEKLSELSTDGSGEITLLHDALLAFSESSRIFIRYLSATANDICMDSKRQTIKAEDVFKALEEIEFPEFIEPLRASLEECRRKYAVKRAGSSKAKEGKKSKKEEQPTEIGSEEQHDCKVDHKDEDENESEKEDGNAHDNTSG